MANNILCATWQTYFEGRKETLIVKLGLYINVREGNQI